MLEVKMKQTLLTLCLIVFALPSWGENYFDTGNIVAANVKILKSMLKHLRKKTT